MGEEEGADGTAPTGAKKPANIRTLSQRQAEIELEEDENIATLVDIKRWKYKGQFINKFLQTCPQPVAIDGRNDRPVEEKQYKSSN